MRLLKRKGEGRVGGDGVELFRIRYLVRDSKFVESLNFEMEEATASELLLEIYLEYDSCVSALLNLSLYY